MKLKFENLKKCFETAVERDAAYGAIKVTIPGNKKGEVIINHKEDLMNKLEYYKKTYDDNLIHKYNSDIRIIGCSYGYDYDDIEEDLSWENEDDEISQLKALLRKIKEYNSIMPNPWIDITLFNIKWCINFGYEQFMMKEPMSDDKIKHIAILCHSINKLYCESIGDFSQNDWHHTPKELQDSIISGVKYHLTHDITPEQSHEEWLKYKEAEGWIYGEKKDIEKKIHPCMVSYNELPEEQKAKDEIITIICDAYK